MPTENGPPRPDHFSHLRDAPEAEPDPNAPIVSPALVEYLEARFPVRPLPPPETFDAAVKGVTQAAVMIGHHEVITHLRSLIKAG